MSAESAGDWRPTASWPALIKRAKLLAKLREFFTARGFLEVETPLLSADTVVDRHLDPLGCIFPSDVCRLDVGRRMWLQTSPEFHMKRLLAAGAGPIYQVTRSFRMGEVGPRHNPEFTLVEWYRPGDDYAAGMQLLSDLCEVLLGRGPAQRVTYADAFRAGVGIDPHAACVENLQTTAHQLGVNGPEFDDDRDGWLDLLVSTRVMPKLGFDRPTLLCDWPPSQAALARVRMDAEPFVAERFELFVDGVELANGYHELLDPNVLAKRTSENNALRRADGKPALPEENRLLSAMSSGLPPCSGCALGFDRLFMAAEGIVDIREAIAFPIDRA